MPVAPLVSVVIPAHNAERFIGEALESVGSQTHERVECLVVDDGSEDATALMVERSGQANLIRQGRAGVSAARNAGARESRGDLIAFLAADDAWYPTNPAHP